MFSDYRSWLLPVKWYSIVGLLCMGECDRAVVLFMLMFNMLCFLFNFFILLTE